ncbi:P-loop containing nucleoside triphosphate hydrolase protein [Trametes maxima]|nr:P-loop containing nucleoside triphosphate hydrolase protein [Trametes maxima]
MAPLSTRNLVPGLPEKVPVWYMQLSACRSLAALLRLGTGHNLAQVEVKAIGVSLRLSEKGAIHAIALATTERVVQITVDVRTTIDSSADYPSDGVRDLVDTLARPHCLLFGVAMMRAAIIIRQQLGADSQSVDLPTIYSHLVKEGVPGPGRIASEVLHRDARRYDINALWYHSTSKDLCLRAWISACIATKQPGQWLGVAKLRTSHLLSPHIECLSLLATNIELLEATKPTSFENEFTKVDRGDKHKLDLHNARFSTRARKSDQTLISINGGQMTARPFAASGRRTQLQVLKGNVRPSEISTITVVGREEATCSEVARDQFFTRLLQGYAVLTGALFVRLLWFPESKAQKRRSRKAAAAAEFLELNHSQRVVSSAMIADNESFVIAHGPPGTGKTTTIAAALQYWQAQKQPVWVIAQSNVGVKNIARSIVKRKIAFKLLVSKEFHFEWHEHLYEGAVEHTLIRSDELNSPHGFDAPRRIGDAQIILCTLAMLSSPALQTQGVFKYRPVQRLVVDEASQIDTSEFLHLFHEFESLEKVCMFGDPKQLPPFGKEQARKMKTIFDFEHLKGASYFLDTQYRMPVPLGEFISKMVYASKLKSKHAITARSCIRAIDVRKGQEERSGSSWQNTEEVHTVVNLVKHYYKSLGQGKLCIITPYDAQRAALIRGLNAAQLPEAAESVYNVDSFQGSHGPPSSTCVCGRPR